MRALLLFVAVFAWVNPAPAFVIDDFNTGNHSLTLTSGDGFSNAVAPGAVGGHRGFYLEVVTNAYGNNATARVNGGAYSHNNEAGVYSWGQLRYGWDEAGNPSLLNLDLTGMDRFRLHFLSADQGINFQIVPYSQGGASYSQFGINLPPSTEPFVLDAPFASFSPFTAGGGFHDIDYLVFQFQAASGGHTGSDLALGRIEAVPLPASLYCFATGLVIATALWRHRQRPATDT